MAQRAAGQMNDQRPQTMWRTVTRLLLAANFFFGFAIIAMLPPFEGIDETAHFSRFQSQMFAPPVPRSEAQKEENAPRLTQDVFDYYRHGPMPYHWIGFDALHQKDSLRGYMTYRDFFDKPALDENYIRDYRQSALQSGYRPGPEFNWQYQHPPLYYMLVGPAMKILVGHASLVTVLFALRMISWILAFVGFSIGLLATRAYLVKKNLQGAEVLTTLGALYPFLMPAFFWEFARLGNDSMCLFFCGIAWALLLWHLYRPKSEAWFFLGFVLGLGWLTKALMIPVTVGILAFVALHSFCVVRKSPTQAKNWWLTPLKFAGLVAFIGAPIYVLNYIFFGSLGPVVFTQAANTHDMWFHLQHNFSLHALYLGLQNVFTTAVWLAGSWSYMIIDLPVHMALYVFMVFVMFSYHFAPRKSDPIFQLPLWMILPMLFGLIMHILTVMIVQDNDNTPGYYLHILAPAWALIYSLGLKNLMDRKRLRPIIVTLVVSIILINFFVVWGYATAFAGCAISTLTVSPYYLLHTAEVLKCVGDMPLIFDRLGVLAWPSLALTGFGLTFVLLGISGTLVCKQKVSVS